MKTGVLLLLPNLLGEGRYHEPFLPQSVDKAVESLDGLISESVGGGRRFLGRFKTNKPAHDIPIALLNEHTQNQDLDFLLEPLKKGERWGLISDAGLPCIADPGHNLVYRARQLGILVQAFIGPSSLILALMLSGLSGQNFTFHGYLDKDREGRVKRIQELEKNASKTGYTQIFIETPYHNQAMLEDLTQQLSDETLLSMAWDLTLPTQGILTYPVSIWKKSPLPNIEKKNAVFLIGKR
jgi:16S rRNA (cytidine1402-2'-O)-methyltransferase